MNIEFYILKIIKRWSDDGGGLDFDGMWYGYDTLQDELCEEYDIFEMKEIKKAVKKLKADGKLRYLTTYNCEGKINGKGYFYNKPTQTQVKTQEDVEEMIGNSFSRNKIKWRQQKWQQKK